MPENEKTCETCESTSCAAKQRKPQESKEAFLERQAITRRMCQIDHKILVVSGKGGVGKSTIAVNLAVALAQAGREVGLLDIDIHGPSVPRLLGLEGQPVGATDRSLLPVQYAPNLKVMSIGFLLQRAEDAVIWRGPMKFHAIKQFLKDVEWGRLDYLIVDSPPGTGDEPLSIAQLIPDATGAIVVTTPQEVAIADVRRCIGFCRQLQMRVLGVVENMSGFVCPNCGATVEIFKKGGGKRMAREMGVPFLGSVPIDPKIVETSDSGKPYTRHFAASEAARAFQQVIAPMLALSGQDRETAPDVAKQEPGNGHETIRIAIPLAQGKLSAHFGHCEQFALIDADRAQKKIAGMETVEAPDHQPGLLPRWLAERGVNVVIAGGMGQRAIALFEQQGIEVRVGSPTDSPEQLARLYLDGNLPEGENVCDH